MFHSYRALWTDEGGLTTVEYAMLLSLIAVSAIVVWQSLGSRVQGTVTTATNSLPAS
jgi:Flp pilus assembly pilin Flp